MRNIHGEDDTAQKVSRILLYSWDPIGVCGYPGASDEYDRYVDEVCRMLRTGADVAAIKDYLYLSASSDMGLDYPELLEKSGTAAREVIEMRNMDH